MSNTPWGYRVPALGQAPRVLFSTCFIPSSVHVVAVIVLHQYWPARAWDGCPWIRDACTCSALSERGACACITIPMHHHELLMSSS